MTGERDENIADGPSGSPGGDDGRFAEPFGLVRHLSVPVVRLDAVPVLDLCVIALLFSLVFTRFVIVPGVRIDLPESAMVTQHTPTGVAVLTIQNEGMLFFDGGVYEVESIDHGFRSYIERTRTENPVLLVKSEADLSMQAFLRVCESAQANGFAEIHLAADRTEALEGSGVMGPIDGSGPGTPEFAR